MRRRDFIAGLVGATAGPLTGRAQQRAKPVLGFLNTASAQLVADYVRAFREGLNTLGYVEGRNLEIDYRWSEGNAARIKDMALELVRHRVDVIAALGGSPAALAAKAATSTIPVVFQVGIDPVRVGLVESLNRPGGNITGVTTLASDLSAKRLEILRELAPAAPSFGVLVNPNGVSAKSQTEELRSASQRFGVRLQVLEASRERELEPAFERFAAMTPKGALIGADPLFNSFADRLGALATRFRIPVIYQSRSFAAAGSLMSYGGSISDGYFQAGVYCARILKGDKPADLPVHQSTKVELIVNLNAAKALGIEMPQTLLARADEVIE